MTKPLSKTVTEADRLLPAGIRNIIRDSDLNEDLSYLGPAVKDYLRDHEMAYIPTTGAYRGMFVLTPLGKSLRSTNIKKLEG